MCSSDLVNDAFCENEDAREDTANDLLGKAGIPTSKRREIANALSSAATSNEIKEALVSNCDQQNPKVMKAVWAVFSASGLKLNGMFETPDDVRDMFCLMGSYLTDDQRRLVRNSLSQDDRPINPSICLTNQEREQWDQNRINFYENQGLDPNAARDFVNGLNNKMNRDLADVLDSLAKGPEGLPNPRAGRIRSGANSAFTEESIAVLIAYSTPSSITRGGHGNGRRHLGHAGLRCGGRPDRAGGVRIGDDDDAGVSRLV